MKNTMKKGIMLLALALLVAGGVFAQRVGDTGQFLGSNWTVETVNGNRMTLIKAQGGTTFNSIADFRGWLELQPQNTPSSAYNVKINISAFGGISGATGSIGAVLNNNKERYVNIDFSDSTFDSLPGNAFYGRTTLTGLTIPKSVSSIGNMAFYGCTNLTSMTFLGIVPESKFVTTPGIAGDLRAKHLAGREGTYTRAAGGTTWTKQ
jgi:hypothetical protein